MLIASLKKIDQKIKKEEKEEKTLAKLVANDLEEAKMPAEFVSNKSKKEPKQ